MEYRELEKYDILCDRIDFEDKIEINIEAPGIDKTDYTYNTYEQDNGTLLVIDFDKFHFYNYFNFRFNKNNITIKYNNQVYRLIVEKL